jgi:hypothetical protein
MLRSSSFNLSHAATSGVLPPALRAVATEAVSAALAAEFPHDALLGKDLSRAVSVINSVVKRSGHVIERVLADTLQSHGLIVYRSVAMPVTQAAENVVTTNPIEVLKTVRIKADSEAKRNVFIDLLVINLRRSSAMIYELKRGGGVTEQRKRVPIEHNLRCCSLQLHSFVRQLGHDVETVGCHIVDYYGASGFDPFMTIKRDQLDEHFGLPVADMIESALAVMSDGLMQALPKLLGSAVTVPAEKPSATREPVVHQGAPISASKLPTPHATLVIDPRYVGALDFTAMPGAKLAPRRGRPPGAAATKIPEVKTAGTRAMRRAAH